jgi:hypothetical protein
MALRALEPRGSRWRRRFTAVALACIVCAAAVASASCGGSSSAAGSSSAKTSSSSGERLPGTKEFGLTDEEFAAHVERTESLIASCMADAGFEYVPADVETVERAMSAVRTEPGYTREEYKKRWGYGASTRFDNVVKEIELGDQNLRYFGDLSEADQVAYERTLYGEDPDATFAFTFDEEDFSGTSGCTRGAVEQVFTREQLLASYVNPKDILVEHDPRVVEANAKWTACMQEAGYDYLDQDEIIDEFEERFDDLVGEDDPATLTGARAEELKQMQTEEIAISLVDLRCQIAFTDSVIRQVEIEVFGVPVSG